MKIQVGSATEGGRAQKKEGGRAQEKEGGKPRKKEGGKSKNGLRKSGQNIGNPYQIEDNKAAPSAPPQGGGASRRPLGVCCLRFGKDFLCFGMISGAHSGSILIFPPPFSQKGFSSIPGAPSLCEDTCHGKTIVFGSILRPCWRPRCFT